jgi:hypothetical protein
MADHEEQFGLEMKEALARNRAEDAARAKARLWLIPAFAAALAVVFFFAVSQRTTAPTAFVEVSLAATRSAESAPAPASKALVLNLDSAGLASPVPHRFRVVDSSGALILEGEAKVTEGKIAAAVPRALSAGDYWVRLYNDAGELQREYGLKVR